MRISDWSSDVCSSDLDGYAAARESGQYLPTNWFASVDLFERSEVMRDYLGDRFVEMFACVKRTEQDRFYGEIPAQDRSEVHTSELQSLMLISYAAFCLKKEKYHTVRHSLLPRYNRELDRPRIVNNN